jgi:membrane-associated protein
MVDIFNLIINFFFHIDKNLALAIRYFGPFSYLILFFVIFMETGFVVTPFLPGDSLLFASGALSTTGSFNIVLLWMLMVLAAFLGDTVNYWIGHFIGPKAFNPDFVICLFNRKFKMEKVLKQEYLEKAQTFYDKHGGKAIVLARFVPIVRTFAPFVAGIGKMSYGRFVSFNLVGGVLWVSLFTLGGFFFGSIPIVQRNFHFLVLAIILVSLVPIFYEWVKTKTSKS